jgi:hypothetical protein
LKRAPAGLSPLVIVLAAAVLHACESRIERSVTTPSPPPPTINTGPTTTPPAANEAPVLSIKVHPHQGPAPLDVNVNMCQTTDPDGDPLTYEYKWGGTGHRKVTTSCREDHTYAEPGKYKAFFCANDGHDHEVCFYELIVVG